MANEKLTDAVRTLSSCTIAVMTDCWRYGETDVIQAEFVEFSKTLDQDTIWQHAWTEFLLAQPDWQPKDTPRNFFQRRFATLS